MADTKRWFRRRFLSEMEKAKEAYVHYCQKRGIVIKQPRLEAITIPKKIDRITGMVIEYNWVVSSIVEFPDEPSWHVKLILEIEPRHNTILRIRML